MALQMSLANHLLVAMPTFSDSNFSHTVIYVCEHHIQGTVGLIINRPMQFHLNLVFDQLHIETALAEKNNIPLMFGGPVQPERGFVIHRPFGHWRSSLSLLGDDVTITTSNDIIRAIAENKGPKDVLVALGYVGWGDYQLEQEIIDDTWLVCPFTPEILYEVPFQERWQYAGLTLGVHMDQVISDGGHA